MATLRLTSNRIDELECGAGKRQDFFRDEKTPWLAVKVTNTGRKTYIFETWFNGRNLRMTIGDVRSWMLQKARERAHELKSMCDKGIDPRQQMTEQLDKAESARIENKRRATTLGDAWPIYCNLRKPHWSHRYYNNHIRFAHPGGDAKKVGKGMTKAGALHQLMSIRLTDFTKELMADWIRREKQHRATNVLMCFDLIRGFANWAHDRSEYQGLFDVDIFTSRMVLDELPKRKAKDDKVLQREHLMPWFIAIRMQSQLCSTYLQALLLTGARKNEMAALKWEDVDFKYRQMTIRDKEGSKGGEDGSRTIPIPPYLSSLLTAMPRIDGNPYVFASKRSKCGYITEARLAHVDALNAATLPHLTLHGLRKSFATLSEWVEMPVGIAAQIMGHKPSATAEKHYKRRSIDLLRHWHDKIEAWFLKEAGIDFAAVQPVLRLAA